MTSDQTADQPTPAGSATAKMVTISDLLDICDEYDAGNITKGVAIAVTNCEPWQWHELLRMARMRRSAAGLTIAAASEPGE